MWLLNAVAYLKPAGQVKVAVTKNLFLNKQGRMGVSDSNNDSDN
jgi:hypothetical protein